MSIVTNFQTSPSPPYSINDTFLCTWNWVPLQNQTINDFTIDITHASTQLTIGKSKFPDTSTTCQVPSVDSQELVIGLTTDIWSIGFAHNSSMIAKDLGLISFPGHSQSGDVGIISKTPNFSPQNPSGSAAASAASAASAAASAASAASSQDSSSISPAVIAGSAIGAVALVALVAFLFWWRFRRSRQADSAAKKELMADGSFTARGPNYQFVYGDATNEVSPQTENIGHREKYTDSNSAPQSPVSQEPPRPILPVVSPKPYKPLLQGPVESTTTTANAPYKHTSSQIRYVPAIAGPGEVSSPAPTHSDPYGDSKTQEDE